MAVTFGATFAGVLASFILWFGSERLIRWLRERRTVDHLLSEVRGEIAVNIMFLRKLAEALPHARTEVDEKEASRLFVPERALTSACRYAVVSGELRLIRDRRKREAIRNCADACDIFNATADKTDLMIALFMLRPDGMALVNQRQRAFDLLGEIQFLD